MNAFRMYYVNSRCCNHFPSHTVVTVSLAANCRRAGSQLELHPLQRCSVTRGAPPHVSTPLKPAVYRRHSPAARAGSQPALPGVSRARPLVVTSAKRCPTRPASPVAPRPVVLPASSTGARLRCASAILPFYTWRHALFY